MIALPDLTCRYATRDNEGYEREHDGDEGRYDVMPSPDSSFRISVSVSIFLSCVASSRSPFFAFSLSSSMALSYSHSRVT